MKLTYWVAACNNGSSAYDIRRPTRREVVKKLIEFGFTAKGGEHGVDYAAVPEHERVRPPYEPPCKVTVEYDNAFDLLHQCMSEASGSWEMQKNGQLKLPHECEEGST